jgi:hypothetical protein
VHLLETDEYTWIQDLDVDNDNAGPFTCSKDALADILGDSPQQPQPQSIKVIIEEVKIATLGPSQVLLKVYSDGAEPPLQKQFFVSCELFDGWRMRIAALASNESAQRGPLDPNPAPRPPGAPRIHAPT